MTAAPSGEVTTLLRPGPAAIAQHWTAESPWFITELRRMARRYMRNENPGNTLQTQALVNEAYLKLVAVNDVAWQNRAHFFAVSAQIMRRILVDAARARTTEKRGGEIVKLDLNESIDGTPERGRQLVKLDEALDALAQFDERKAQVVEMKFFGGLSVEEIAEVLKVSPRSVMRDRNLARAWLAREMAH